MWKESCCCAVTDTIFAVRCRWRLIKEHILRWRRDQNTSKKIGFQYINALNTGGLLLIFHGNAIAIHIHIHVHVHPADSYKIKTPHYEGDGRCLPPRPHGIVENPCALETWQEKKTPIPRKSQKVTNNSLVKHPWKQKQEIQGQLERSPKSAKT